MLNPYTVNDDSHQTTLPATPFPFAPATATTNDRPRAQRHLSVGEARLLPFTLESKPLFELYARRQESTSADLGFCNNFMWLNRMSAFYQVIDGCFCLFSLNGNRLSMLLPPLGAIEDQPQALEGCFAIMDEYNAEPSWSVVDFVGPQLATQLNTSPQWSLEPHFPDYIYRTGDLIELRGNPYKSKRGEINQFLRACPAHRLESLQPHHHDGIRALLNTWLRERLKNLEASQIGDFLASSELERQGIERALDHFEALGLSGRCLIVDGRIEGFTFGERVSERVASILVEKTNFAIPGAAQFLFREFARHFADCDYINVGDDMGLENMRRVKMSYRPVMFAEKFTLRRNTA